MTPDQIQLVVAEIERRWRSRTPAASVLDALPDDRVNRSEIWDFMQSHGIQWTIRDDEFDRAVFQLFDKLRKEFPHERWEPKSHWTAATKERRKELGM